MHLMKPSAVGFFTANRQTVQLHLFVVKQTSSVNAMDYWFD
jgi:hypothetical protein